MNRLTALFGIPLLFACGVERARPGADAPGAPGSQVAAPPVFDGVASQQKVAIDLQKKPDGGEVPNLGGGPLFSNAGAFTFPNGTNPGSATFVAAPVIDWMSNVPPTSFGSGTWANIQVAGTTYSENNAESMAGVMPDDQGTDYLVLSAYTEVTDPVTGITTGTVVHVLVLASDFSPGGSVALDGVDRLAIFATGDISLPDPQVAAAAATGTVTFTAGGLNLGDLITADVAGDFGEIHLEQLTAASAADHQQPDAGELHPELRSGVARLLRWNARRPGARFCRRDAGEPQLHGGSVTLAAGALPGSFDISGAPISSGFGTSTLTLESFPDAPGVVGGFTNATGTGPANTTFMGTYLALDGSTASATQAAGWAGAGYMNAAQDGFCQVDFMVELGP